MSAPRHSARNPAFGLLTTVRERNNFSAPCCQRTNADGDSPIGLTLGRQPSRAVNDLSCFTDELAMNTTVTPPNPEVALPVPRAPEPSEKETALVAWLAFLILGGGLLALYYARVGYLPDIEWHLTLVYLAVASFIGGAYGLLQSLAIFLPGYIWCETLICDSHIIGAFCHAEPDKLAPSVVRHEPSVFRIFLLIGLPFLVCIIISHVALYWGIRPYVGTTIILQLFASVYATLMFSHLLDLRKARMERGGEVVVEGGERASVGDERWERAARLCKYVFWFDLSVLLSQIATLLIYYLSDRPCGWPYIKISAVCITVVLISNHVVAVRFWENHRQAIGASLAASLLLLVAADHFTHLPEKIMDLYGFGENHKVDITLVSADGADAVGKLGLSNNGCATPARDKLCGVKILSAIGSEYLIKLGPDDAYTVFTVPKSMVVSHAESRSNAEPPRPCEPK
jgi:hypothetical protein